MTRCIKPQRQPKTYGFGSRAASCAAICRARHKMGRGVLGADAQQLEGEASGPLAALLLQLAIDDVASHAVCIQRQSRHLPQLQIHLPISCMNGTHMTAIIASSSKNHGSSRGVICPCHSPSESCPCHCRSANNCNTIAYKRPTELQAWSMSSVSPGPGPRKNLHKSVGFP